jgi:hypothetical protein
MTTTRRYWTVAVFLVGMVWFGAPEQAAADNNHFRIRVQHTNKCLDVQNAYVTNGARLQQWDCGPAGQVNQTFNFVEVGSGASTYHVTAANSVKCLDIGGPNPAANGAPLQQWDCNTQWAQPNQVLQLQPAGIGDYYYIKPTNSGKCLDVADISYANGALIQQWDCASGQSNQLWLLEYVGPRVPRHHVQMFGYLDYAPASSMGSHANLTGVYVGEDVPGIVANGGKGYYNLARMAGFFKTEHKSTYPTPGPGQPPLTMLIDDWEQRVCNLVGNVMGPTPPLPCPGANYPGHAAFFYWDEPYWNYSAGGMVGNNGWTINEVHYALQTVAAALKSRFPNVPIVIVEAVPMLSTMMAPASVDWFGFDCYGQWSTCQTSGIPGHLSTLKSRLNQPHHKIILVPWAMHETSAGPLTQQALDNMHDAANRYVELALSDQQIVALALYKWHSDAVEGTGLPDIPSLYTRYQFLGRALGFGQ